jgi:membrane dipeptidase
MRATLDDVVTHIAYVAEKFGVDCVGIGTDFFEGEPIVRFDRVFRVRAPDVVRNYTVDTVYAEGFSGVSMFPRLTEMLIARGFSDDDILKILGGNFMRVFDTVWARK